MTKIKRVDVHTDPINGIITKIERIYKDGVLHKEVYCNNKNRLHRDSNSYGGDGPAIIRYTKDGKAILSEYWYQNGEHHRDDGLPAITRYSNDGKEIISHEWMVRGKYKRDEDKPTYIVYNKTTGRTTLVIWKNDLDSIHRDPNKGPALMKYNFEGLLKERKYYINDVEYPNRNVALIYYAIHNMDDKKLEKCLTFIKSLE